MCVRLRVCESRAVAALVRLHLGITCEGAIEMHDVPFAEYRTFQTCSEEWMAALTTYIHLSSSSTYS